MRQARKEVPRFSRQARMARDRKRSGFTTVSGRGAAQYATVPQATAQFPAFPVPAARQVPARRRGFTYRHRYQLIPVAWALTVLGAGSAAHAAHSLPGGIIVTLGLLLAGWLLTRHLENPPEIPAFALLALTLAWLPAITLAGLPNPAPAVYLTTWAFASWRWAKHYRVRPGEPADEPEADNGEQARWARMMHRRKWSGRLAACTRLPGGGRQWEIVLDGAETHIGQLMGEPRVIAATFGRSVTEAYVEQSPDGNEARGLLTILNGNTLQQAREWDGSPIDPQTGMAVVGRFPDGKPLHERSFIPRNGSRHTVIAGADGSGKSGLLNLGLCLSATSGLISPVILDPQEGQALPDWAEFLPYARGAEECLAYLYGLHAALFDRSRYLASFRWKTDDGSDRKGIGFFDAHITGLPIIEINLDESPALLTHPKLGDHAGELLADIGKLGRKAGFRLRTAIQVPSLAEFGGAAQPLRSMLVGGNTFCGRTGDRVTQGMLNAAADPSVLPKYFPDLSPTVGLGYSSGPDNRPSTPVRWDWVRDPFKVASSAQIRKMDDRCAESMDRAAGMFGGQLILPVHAEPEPETAEEGRTAQDAVLTVLGRHDGQVSRGTVIKDCAALVTGEWSRARPFSTKSIQNALTALSESGRIDKPASATYAVKAGQSA